MSKLHRFALVLLALCLTACAFLAGAIKIAGPMACAELVSVIDPGDGRTVVAELCPAVANALAGLLAEQASTSGDAGRTRFRHGGATCDPMQVTTIDPTAHRAAYLCTGRLGGEEQARLLYAAAIARIQGQDGGAP